MERKIIYVANDGTEFLEEKECIAYERETINQKFNNVFASKELEMWNHEHESITTILIDAYPSWGLASESALSVAKYISVKSENALTLLRDHAEEQGYYAPYEIGEWIWDDDCGTWRKISDFYHETLKEIDFCRSAGLLPKAD